MKTIIIIICCLACAIEMQAQSAHISYTYVGGNRIQRKYIEMKAITNGNSNNSLTTNEVKGDSETSEVLPEPVYDKLVTHDITIFPNPTKGKMSVSITNVNSDEKANIVVFDVSGKIYFETINTGNISDIDLSSLPASTYFLKIEIAGQKTVWEIIKQ